MMYYLSLSMILLCAYFPINYIAYQLLLLNAVISILASIKYQDSYAYYLNILVLVIYSAFLSDSIWIFYISFETMLLPIFYTIYYSGQIEDRIYVSYKFIYFALTYSLVWLAALLYYITWNNLNTLYISIFAIMFIIALLVKLPLPPLHLWLNDTHTGSPVSSSILLAGTVLKLSIFGYISFWLPNYYYSCINIKSIIITMVIYGAIYTSIICIRQVDYKRFIAYTSVGHMNIAFFPLLFASVLSMQGSYLLLFAHGFISASLFYHVNSIYTRLNTKNIYYIRGISIVMPLLSLSAIILHLFNIALPPAISWLSEYFIFSITIHQLPINTALISTVMIISLIYTFWIYFRVYFGNIFNYIYRSSDNSLLSAIIIFYFTLFALITIYIFIDI